MLPELSFCNVLVHEAGGAVSSVLGMSWCTDICQEAMEAMRLRWVESWWAK